jgi:hypothetical protein
MASVLAATGGVGVLSIVAWLGFSVPWLCVFVIAGFLPAIAAYLGDPSRQKFDTVAVGTLSAGAMLPFVLDGLANAGRTGGREILANPYAWISVYVAAAFAYALCWLFPMVVNVLYENRAQARIRLQRPALADRAEQRKHHHALRRAHHEAGRHRRRIAARKAPVAQTHVVVVVRRDLVGPELGLRPICRANQTKIGIDEMAPVEAGRLRITGAHHGGGGEAEQYGQQGRGFHHHRYSIISNIIVETLLGRTRRSTHGFRTRQ